MVRSRCLGCHLLDLKPLDLPGLCFGTDCSEWGPGDIPGSSLPSGPLFMLASLGGLQALRPGVPWDCRGQSRCQVPGHPPGVVLLKTLLHPHLKPSFLTRTISKACSLQAGSPAQPSCSPNSCCKQPLSLRMIMMMLMK